MSIVRRAVSSLSRRTGRPELLAVVSSVARQQLHEEIGVRTILAATLARDDTYIDIGTNRGQLLAEAVRVAPQGRHRAFEPIPALAEQIRRSFPHVDCRQIALGARPETAEFCYFRKLDGWSGLKRSPEISDERGAPEFISVDVSTLDLQAGDLNPRVIKIDVEGAELAVLEGGRSLLSGTKPTVIFEHVASASALYGARSQMLWNLLAELGYAIFSADGHGPFSQTQFAANTTNVNWLARAALSSPARPSVPRAGLSAETSRPQP
jgi:FkbM family methyltransferase